MAKKREHFIIDGYNVIHALPELASLAGDLAEARDRLLHLLMEYGAYEKYDMTVVFDALFASGEEHKEQVAPHFEVIYTGEGVTADSCIERLAYESVRTSREVHVVTSDGGDPRCGRLSHLIGGALAAREEDEEKNCRRVLGRSDASPFA